MRRQFLLISLGLTAAVIALGHFVSIAYYNVFVLLGPVLVLGYYDFFQKRHTIRRNFPVLGHFRYLLESIRPEINQYFVESNSDGVPFSREQRSVVYQRAKKQLDTIPFGTQQNVYEVGYEFLAHSIRTTHVDPGSLRVTVGGPQCLQPYNCSIFNISAMSYGSLSKRAILSLNGGAKDAGFLHNTGEGGLSPYHLENGGDLVWQIGTAYFSARTPDGRFSEQAFAEKAVLPQVKMIELKISQGAKPGHGGLLPGKKVTEEIAAIRGVLPHIDVHSPASHSAFSTPVEMMEFIGKLRELSGGKPVGFKLCIGKRREFIAICKAMLKTGIYPDFITVDGGEGGTGAAPLEFSNFMGLPSVEGLIFVHNCLLGFDLRQHIKIFATGKVTTGFGIIKKLSIGADVVNAGRAFMLALGCIQALRCHNNKCPTGVATNDPSLVGGLHVPDKRRRVANYHRETMNSVAALLGAMGLSSTRELRPWHILRRVGLNQIRHYAQIYNYLPPGSLLHEPYPQEFARVMETADHQTFSATVEAEAHH